MVEKIKAGVDVSSIPEENARKAVLSINGKVAWKLGIVFYHTILRQALVRIPRRQ